MRTQKTFRATLLLAALLLASSPDASAQTSDQMPADQGQWQTLPEAEAGGGSAKNNLPSWMQYKSPYSGKQVDIGVSHMSASEVAAWTQDTVSDVLSFAPDTFSGRVGGFKKYFATSGWQAYADYVRRNSLPEIVKAQGYTVNAIVKDPPRVLKEGAAAGVYRWVVEAPVILSLARNDSKGQVKTVPATARQTRITVQIARIAEGQGSPEGLIIENWFSRDPPMMPGYAAPKPAAQQAPAATTAKP